MPLMIEFAEVTTGTTQTQPYLGHSDKACTEEEQLSFPTKMAVEYNTPLWRVYC